MSDVFVTITEGLERGIALDEIAYQLTCEYPPVDFHTAMEMIADVQKFEEEYLGELQ
jgi:hypothetical protein